MSVKFLIQKKRDGGIYTRSELESLMAALLDGTAKDYQLSAWLMAVFLKGMNSEETVSLVEAMWRSGKSVPRDESKRGQEYWIDKHSTGGVGDKTSLILVPLVSSVCERILGKGELKIPMLSGRSLGHSGGTLDKLEAVPGFRTDISLDAAKKLLDESGFFMMGQTSDIAPADRILYSLRDATSTVESLPLVVSSILSKKLSESLDGLVFDVKFGEGAFFESEDRARELGRSLIDVAKRLGVEARGLLTRMDEPLGRMVGNSVEVEECAEFLSGGEREDGLNEVTLRLATQMVEMATRGKIPTAQIEEELELELSTGRAWDQFVLMFRQQGGDWERWKQANAQWKAERSTFIYRAPTSGFISRVGARKVSAILESVGGLRPHKEATVNPMSGVRLLKKVGDRAERGEAILEVYYRGPEAKVDRIEGLCSQCVELSGMPVTPKPWIAEVLS